jgi:Asp-tRNA(Asn)/Glu-tRNA(Gln) amidotransferase A subunit family amidase
MADPVLSSDASRREFLLTTGVFAAGALMTAPAVARQQPQQSPPPLATQPQRRDEEAEEEGITPQRDRPVVDVAVIAAAEQLAGISFTQPEREMVSRTIAEQVEMFASRQTLPRFANDLAPAMKFDPRLPGMTFDIPKKASVWSNAESGPLPENDEDIAFAPVAQLARWIEAGKLTATRLTKIYLDRLKRLDEKLKCVITLCEDRALKQAADADREIAAGNYRGPLHGIPWGAKDLLDTADIRTTWGAEPWIERVPTVDATVVTKLNEAGAVLVAKLSLGALAYNDIWFGGRTNNPWNPRQGSSGSSAGSAAATAAGLVGFSIGTETYGSITSPCIRCGTTGLRPTFGRVSRAGAMALCWSLDKIGPICRTVEDCALVLDAINGHDEADPSSIALPLRFDMQRPLNSIHVGYSPQWFEEGNDLDRTALAALEKTGVRMLEVDLPDWPYDILLTMLYCEAAAAFEDLTRSNLDDTLRWQAPQAWPNTFRQSWFLPGIELVQADRFRRQCMQMMAERFENVDVLFGPSFAASLCLITNNTGHPSLTLRSGFHTPRQRDRDNDEGRQGDAQQPERARAPHGISFIGRLFDEGTMCRIGLALERELNVWQERPPIA